MISDVLQAGRPRQGASVSRQLERSFRTELATRGHCADPVQLAAIKLLGDWLEGWLRGRWSWLRAPKVGVYLWGSVGRGKSFVMDAFFAAAPLEAKRRVHFHAFVQEVLEELSHISGQPDPLALVASRIAADTRLLCFDEFHVHDLGDAMLLGRLVNHLVDQGVGLIATSNYEPRALCSNPLYRDRFKPAIELIERSFEIFNLDGGEDYRQRVAGGYVWGEYVQVAADAQAGWVAQRMELDGSTERDMSIEVNHRTLWVRARHRDAAWLDFDELCRSARSSADFLWLNRTFERLVITGVPTLDGEGIDVQQRFLNLIDIFYDSGVELILVSEASPEELLTAGAHVDFSRTHSRLQQLMRISTEYAHGEQR